MASPAENSLLRAWREGDIETFQAVLNIPGINLGFIYPEEGYRNILESVAECTSTYSKDFITALLSNGAYPDLVNATNGSTPMHVAIEALNYPVLDALLDAKASLNIQDSTGNTPLHLLCSILPSTEEDKQLKCLQLLLDQPGINTNLKNKKNQTPVQIACQQGAYKIMKILQDHSTKNLNVIEDDKEAEQSRKSDFLNDLIQVKVPKLLSMGWSSNGIKMDANKLFNLLYSGNEDRFCIAFAKEIEAEDGEDLLTFHDGYNTFLQYAAGHGRLKAAKTLLQHGADVNFCVPGSRRPLYLACENGDGTMLRLLLAHNPDLTVNSRGETVLHVITKADGNFDTYLECLSLLLSTRININAKDSFGRTALHYAAIFPRTDAIGQLLEAGANIFIEDDLGEPAYKNIPMDILNSFLDTKISWNQRRGGKCVLNIDLRFFNPKQKNNSKDKEEDPLKENESNDCIPEAEKLIKLANSKSLCQLLEHPVFKTFISHKWTMMRPFYFIELLCFVLFYIHLLLYIISYRDFDETATKPHVILVKVIVILFLIIRYVLLLLSVAGGPYYFIKNSQRFVNLFLTILATVLVAKDCSKEFSSDSFSSNFCPKLSAIVALLATIQLILLLGEHPKLTLTFSIFTTVSQNVAKICLGYFLVFTGLAISLHVLARQCTDCSSLFIDGVASEVPLVYNGRGHAVHGKAAVLFIFFWLCLLAMISHVIAVNVSSVAQILKHKDLFSAKKLLKFMESIEDSLVFVPQERLHQFGKYIALKEIIFTWLKFLARKSLYFEKGDRCLCVEPDNENLLSPKSSKKDYNFWKPGNKLPQKIVTQMEEKLCVKDKVEINEEPMDETPDKVNLLLESTKQFSARLETLEETCKQIEKLLIQSMAIVSLNNDTD